MKEKEKDKLFDNLPACAADFIKLVIKKMRYRKKVQADVQAELITHFEDELKDCASDEEKQQKAQQLIAEFGDAKLLAVLLRRAKKRCRPLWRTAIARTFQTIGILILCLIIYVAWFLSGKPVITTNYVAQLNRLVRPAADQSLNAAPLYHKAAELSEELSDDFLVFFSENYKPPTDEKRPTRRKPSTDEIADLFRKKGQIDFAKRRQDIQKKVTDEIFHLMSKRYNQLTDQQNQIIERWMEEHKEAVELIIAGTHKPHYWQKYEGEKMISVLMPVLGDFRRIAYSLCWRAGSNAHKHRYKDAFEDLTSCYRLGQHLKGDKTLIEQLIGMTIESMAVETLHDILSNHQIDSATLAKLLQGFEQIIATEDFTVSFKAEKLAMYDEIQRCFTEDGIVGGHISREGLKHLQTLQGVSWPIMIYDEFWSNWTKPLHILFTHPNKQETREMTDRYYAFLDEIARKTPAQIHAEGINVGWEAMEIIKGNILLKNFASTLDGIYAQSYIHKANIESTLAIIALLRYNQDVGSYPQNLEELIEAGYLKELPMDPYSDKPLVYKKTNGDFILYSIGCNFKDDGGEVCRDDKGRINRWADEGDRVFWPVLNK
jgi:hypothetical protein